VLSSSPSSLQWDPYMTVHPVDIYSDTSSNTTTSPSPYAPLWEDSYTPSRRASFGGFPGPKWITKRPKLCIPDFSVWDAPSGPLPPHML
jgi:hypothetical protein